MHVEHSSESVPFSILPHDKMLFCLTVLPDPSDDLFDVKSELTPVSANWKDIGIALRLSPNTLDGIQAGSSGDPVACLTSMATEWLRRNYNVTKFGEPTWQKLVEVVGHPAGAANKALARDIARRHKAGGKLRPLSVSTQVNRSLKMVNMLRQTRTTDKNKNKGKSILL